MKNKSPLIIGLFILVAGVIGAFYFMRASNSSILPQTPEETVANALTGSGSVKCEYTDESGQITTAYVKGGNVRTNMTGGPEGPMSFIMKDQTTWSWNDTTKEGFLYKIPEVTGTDVEVDETVSPEQYGGEDMQAEIEKYKESCVNAAINDQVFEVPTDVNFQDYSTMMQDTMQQVPQEYQQYMPQ